MVVRIIVGDSLYSRGNVLDFTLERVGERGKMMVLSPHSSNLLE